MSAHDAVDGSSTGTGLPLMWALLSSHDSEEPIMQAVTTIGLDIAKSVFQVHGIDAEGKVRDRYLRSLFTAGALAVIRYAKIHGTQHWPWLMALLAQKPTKVAAIALAKKIARMAWALMAKGQRYNDSVALGA